MTDHDKKGNKSNQPSSQDKKKVSDPSRRRFIKNTGLVLGGVVGGSVLGGLATDQFTKQETSQSKEGKPEEDYTEARMFFNRFEDFVVLEQASERIYPKSKSGPGAIELGVPYFIDKQLASPWGVNAKDYRQGPFVEKDVATGQSRMNRRNLFVNAIRKMNELSQERFNTTFDKATEEQQIEILQDFESDKVDLIGVSSASFFELLRMTVIEGAYSDPLYGGNRNMQGWKMKEFPGAVASYMNVIESDEFVKMAPTSLTNYQQK